MAKGHRTLQNQSSNPSRRQFRFNWKMTLFTVLLLPLLISLGLWQLDREQEKIAAQEQYNLRLEQQPVDLGSVNWSDADLSWTQVTANGDYSTDRQFLLDNRILDSRVGYEVITPFVTNDGVVLVNRGWIAQGATRADLPSLDMTEASSQRIVGHIYVPGGETLMLGGNVDQDTTWPRVIQRVDIKGISDALGYQVKPYIVRLAENSDGALRINWPPINMQPEVHRGYAVQWFLMAFALIILYLVFSFRRLEN
jgi:surfeit locus 1 family protein